MACPTSPEMIALQACAALPKSQNGHPRKRCWRSFWTGKERTGFAGDPIGQETHPFARGNIDKAQPFDEMIRKFPEIVAPAHSPVDRIRLHLKPDLAKDADRPWHMKSRRHQKPPLAALRRYQGLGKFGIFHSVARTPFDDQAVFGEAETL